MPKLDCDAIPQTNATGYPSLLDAVGCGGKDGTGYKASRTP